MVGIAALALTHLTGNVGKENEITTENNTNNNDYDNEADDECLSLYYHNHVPEDGSGIPNVGTCSEEEIAKLKMVHDDYRRLPIEFYQKAVGMLPIL